MPIQVDGVRVHAMSGTELSRVRTELHQLCVFPAVAPHPVQPHSESSGHSHLGDVPLTVNRVQENKLLLHTEKTGVHVYCVLPDFVVQAINAAPRSSEHYFFWTGKSTVHGSKGKWQHRLQRLFQFAGIGGGHAHRFRDTFVVELLLAGVPLDRVSILLGHSSIRITERHYAPWTRSRQEQIESDLRAAWKDDPIVLTNGLGVPQVLEKSHRTQ